MIHSLKRDLLAILGPERYHRLLIILAAFFVILIFFPGLTRPLEFLISDGLQELERRHTESTNEVIVLGIDADTLATLSEQWPWGVTFFLKLVQDIRGFHPEKVIFCFPFPTLSSCPENEKKNFLQALSSGKNLFQARLEVRSSGVPLPGDLQRAPESPYLESIPCMAFLSEIDADNRLREVTSSPSGSGSLFPSSAPLLLCLADKEGGVPVIPLKEIFSPEAPVECVASMQLSGPPPGDSLKEFLRDKTVLIGGTAPILHDFRNTAFGQRSSVEIMASLLDANRRSRRVFREYGFGFRLLFCILGTTSGLLLTFFLPKVPLLLSMGISVIFLLTAGTISLFLGWILPWGIGWISWIVASLFVVGFSFFRDQVFIQLMHQEGIETAVVQKAISPHGESVLPDGIHCQAVTRSCEAAAGDFYDHFLQADGSLFFFLGKGSGQGYPAGMVNIMGKAVISQLRREVIHDPANVIAALNDVYAGVFKKTRFMNGIAGLLFPDTSEMLLCSGGIAPTLFVSSDGSLLELEGKNLPMGMEEILERGNLSSVRYAFRPGDHLVLNTKGVFESRNWNGDVFQKSRFLQLVKENLPFATSKVFFDRLFSEIDAFSEGYPLSDDQTLLVVAWTPENLQEKREEGSEKSFPPVPL